ncbi:NADH-quinone oxidoreductase subunit C, partial [archaeon]
LHNKHLHKSLWMRVKKSVLREAIRKISEYGVPHLAVIAGTDLGKSVELLYHFCIGHGKPQQEFVVTIAIELPKKDLTVPTITDLVLTEREKQEFFGIKVVGIPDSRRAFLADDLKNCHPWIRDDPGTKKYARHVHKQGVPK